MTVQVSVISGKGGTGKTTVTASLAYLLNKASYGQVVADCDVDASNLHLLMNPTVKETSPYYGLKTPVIDESVCAGCGVCEPECRFNAIVIENNVAHIKEESCEGCAVCGYVCPIGAISFVDKAIGEVYISDTAMCPMVHASLEPGKGTTGKLVTMVRESAAKIAGKDDVILIDGPPGIGCPVIASVAGVDIAVIVIEPTVSGINDFHRVLKVVRRFGVTPAVCINKYDINRHYTECVEGYCEEAGIAVLGKIPYDREIFDCVCAGVIPASGVNDDLKAYYRVVFDNLIKMIEERRNKTK